MGDLSSHQGGRAALWHRSKADRQAGRQAGGLARGVGRVFLSTAAAGLSVAASRTAPACKPRRRWGVSQDSRGKGAPAARTTSRPPPPCHAANSPATPGTGDWPSPGRTRQGPATPCWLRRSSRRRRWRISTAGPPQACWQPGGQEVPEGKAKGCVGRGGPGRYRRGGRSGLAGGRVGPGRFGRQASVWG